MPNQLTTRQVYLEMAGVTMFGSALFFTLVVITAQTVQRKPRLSRAITTLAGTTAGLATAVVADCLLEERFAESNVENGAKDLLMCVMALAILGNFSLGGFNLETIFRLGCSAAKAILPSSCITFFKSFKRDPNVVEATSAMIELVDTVSGLPPTTAQLFRDTNKQSGAEDKNIEVEVREVREVREEEDDTTTPNEGTYAPPSLSSPSITNVYS